MTKPLPCPRCGGGAMLFPFVVEWYDDGSHKTGYRYMCIQNGHMWHDHYNTPEDALEAWNERPKGEN